MAGVVVASIMDGAHPLVVPVINASQSLATHPLVTNISSNATTLVKSNISTINLVNSSSPHHIAATFVPSFMSEMHSVPTFMLYSVLLMAIVANGFLYISPLNIVMRVAREQMHLKDITNWLVPTYLMFAQTYLWMCYGMCTGLSSVVHFNICGAVMSASYLVVISRCAQPRRTGQQVITSAIIAVLLFSVGVFIAYSGEARSRALGNAATVFNVGMILAPLVDAARVLQTRVLDKFPLTIVLACFFSSVLWAQYAFLMHDQMILIPNLLGAVICGLELSAIYCVAWADGSSGAQGLLLDVDDQPLMPRQRGKSPCANFFGFLSAGQRVSKPRRSSQASGDPRVTSQLRNKLRDHFHPYSTFHEASTKTTINWNDQGIPTAITKSPFSSFGNAGESDVEDLEAFAVSREEPTFEPQASGSGERFAPVSFGQGMGASYSVAQRAADCIL